MQRILFFLFVYQTCIAQVKPEPKPLDVGALKNFPAQQILNAIEKLQTDLKACEQLNTELTEQSTRTNQELTKNLNDTRTLLMQSNLRADSVSTQLKQIGVLTTTADKSLKNSKILSWVERIGLVILTTVVVRTVK